MHQKHGFSARCLCHVESFRASNAKTPGGQQIGVLSALYIKQIKHIMKYQLYMNASIMLLTMAPLKAFSD